MKENHKRYTVILDKAESIENLRHVLRDSKIGKPRAMGRVVIVESATAIQTIANIAGVVSVEEDQIADKSGVVQANPPGWALPWISNSGGSYECEKTGDGVDIYVIDSGVRLTHMDFQGRASTLWSFDGQDYFDDPEDDSPWHGTSVASCAAGTVYGTAKNAMVYSLRINWYFSTIIKALDRILEHHLQKPDGRPSIVNFSGTHPSPTLGDIFNEVIDYGIVVVAAAGNENEDKPRYPARANYIVAVGALNKDEGRAWFSNRQCDVFAPGQGVEAASMALDSHSHVINGTSFAAPYYAGLMACALQGSDKFNSRSQVSDFLFAYKTQLTERNRIPHFPNGAYQVRTVTTNMFPNTWYENWSLTLSDAEINQFCMENQHQPQVIADAAEDHNVSLKRLSGATGYSENEINQYFIDAGVTPWWFTGTEQASSEPAYGRLQPLYDLLNESFDICPAIEQMTAIEKKVLELQ